MVDGAVIRREGMATFQVGTKVITTENAVSVEVTPSAPIAPGVHHFQLVVVDDAGNTSDPATVQIVIQTVVTKAMVEVGPILS